MHLVESHKSFATSPGWMVQTAGMARVVHNYLEQSRAHPVQRSLSSRTSINSLQKFEYSKYGHTALSIAGVRRSWSDGR